MATVVAPTAARITDLDTTDLWRVIARRPIAARGWLRSGGAILVVVSLAACAAAGQLTGTPSGSASASPPASAAVSIVASSTPVPPPPDERLATALAPLAEANAFDSTVTVDGAVAVTSTGRSVAGATQLTVTTSGKTVDYVQIPPRAWARESGGAWVLVAVTEAPGSPLAVLAAPSTLAADPSGGATLLATYPASALGLEGDPVSVTIVIGEAVTFRYESEAGGHVTVSETTIRPATNLEPITAPS